MTHIAHRYPTEIRAGAGALASVIPDMSDGATCLLVDGAIGHPLVDRLADSPQTWRRFTPPVPTLAAVREVGAWLAERAPRTVVAIGGGTTIDIAKLALLFADDAALASRIERLSPRLGAIALRSRRPRGCARLVAVPTTVGTGSEVSPSASVSLTLPSGPARTLISGPALIPDAAVLDSDLTATLPAPLQRFGLFEVFARVVGADIGSISAIPIAAAEAEFLACQVAKALDYADPEEGLPADLRLSASLLSAQSHMGWSLQGRPPTPSPLWVIADEVSSMLGLTKLEVTAALFPQWIHAVETFAMPWGDPARLARHPALSPRRATTVPGAFALLREWSIPCRGLDFHPFTPLEIAERLSTRWCGALPMMRAFTPTSLAGFLAGSGLEGLRMGDDSGFDLFQHLSLAPVEPGTTEVPYQLV
jgi:NADP-dependent alcohol dehydrogenase